MVKGLNRFKQHFAPFTDRYVLIGGTACLLAMQEAGLNFRATKDLAIVLCVEALDKEFGKAFWQFVKDGGYQQQQQSTGKKLFYRFNKPSHPDYPEMIELFSRIPEVIEISDETHLTPIPIDDEISSLSAILLDKVYYQFIHSGKREIEGLSVVGAEHLIPLKARAAIDLSEKRITGANIDKKIIRKHKNDIFRLYQLLASNQRIELAPSIKQDMQKLLDELKNDDSFELKDLGLKNTTLNEVINSLVQIYSIDNELKNESLILTAP